MILKMVDSSDIVITNSEAEIIQAMIEDGTEYIQIGKNYIKRSAIMGIVDGGITSADIPNFTRHTLPGGKRCTGSHSIQNEINQIIRTSEPKNWAKVIRDDGKREEIRQELLSMTDEWCDYKTQKCVCS